MTAIDEAREWLIELAGPVNWITTRENWLARGARKAEISFTKARRIFYRETDRIDADVYLALRREIDAAKKSGSERGRKINELSFLESKILRLADESARRNGVARDALGGKGAATGRSAAAAAVRPAK